MKLPRRKFLHLAAGAAALPAISRAAKAQAYPSRPVRLVVPFGSAGATDITARLVGQWLSERLGQQFIIENRPGAGGNVGTEAVVRAAPDGYTLIVAGNNNAWNPALYDKLSFNFLSDIAPVASIIRFPTIMVVNPSVPAKTLPEFIAYAKSNPGTINMASSGIGAAGHIFVELFKMMASVNLVHVPYRSIAAAMTDLISGQVQVMFVSTAASKDYVKAGTLIALAVTSLTRLEELPNIPAVGEILSGYEASVWFGIGAEGYARRDRRQAQHGGQRGPGRSQDEGAACGSGWRRARILASRLWQAHRRRNREVGQRDPDPQHQGRVIRALQPNIP